MRSGNERVLKNLSVEVKLGEHPLSLLKSELCYLQCKDTKIQECGPRLSLSEEGREGSLLSSGGGAGLQRAWTQAISSPRSSSSKRERMDSSSLYSELVPCASRSLAALSISSRVRRHASAISCLARATKRGSRAKRPRPSEMSTWGHRWDLC